MPSEKQIEAFITAYCNADTSDMKEAVIAGLTAAEQAEPAPVARSGAAKVKAVLELVQYHVTDDDDRATLTAAISALEPTEPAVECCNCGAMVDTREVSEGGDYHGSQLEWDQWVCSPECWDAKAAPAPEAEPVASGMYGEFTPITVSSSTHPRPSDARLREALEDIKAIGQIAVGNATINRMVSIAAAALNEARDD